MCYMSSVLLVVEPSKIIFLIYNAIPQKEDIILLYIGYHSIPKYKTTHIPFESHGVGGNA